MKLSTAIKSADKVYAQVSVAEELVEIKVTKKQAQELVTGYLSVEMEEDGRENFYTQFGTSIAFYDQETNRLYVGS